MRKILFISCLALSQTVWGDPETDLAKKLNNPVAALISVPVEYIVDKSIGALNQGKVTQFKFSPVLPFSLNDNWNIISRTIVSYVEQEEIPTKEMSESGWSDIAESIFFSPKEPKKNGWIWGVGGIFLLDTASKDQLGSGKWAMGPTAIGLKQQGSWTYGALAHYLKDVSGDDERADIEQAFLQPFMSYIISKSKTTFTLQSESMRDMDKGETSSVATFQVGQMFKIGSQIMQARIGVRHWLDSTTFGPDGTTITAKLTLLFPK